MKKILFLIRTLRIGGAEHVLVDVANRMAEKGFLYKQEETFKIANTIDEIFDYL